MSARAAMDQDTLSSRQGGHHGFEDITEEASDVSGEVGLCDPELHGACSALAAEISTLPVQFTTSLMCLPQEFPIMRATPSTQPNSSIPDLPEGVHCVVVLPVVPSRHIQRPIEDRCLCRTAGAATWTARDGGGRGSRPLPPQFGATNERGARCSNTRVVRYGTLEWLADRLASRRGGHNGVESAVRYQLPGYVSATWNRLPACMRAGSGAGCSHTHTHVTHQDTLK